ncbi:uncharacterized protein METZ01_LOCUS333900, partial [marine metagenome]
VFKLLEQLLMGAASIKAPFALLEKPVKVVGFNTIKFP